MAVCRIVLAFTYWVQTYSRNSVVSGWLCSQTWLRLTAQCPCQGRWSVSVGKSDMGVPVSGFNYIFTTFFFLPICVCLSVPTVSVLHMVAGDWLRTAGSFTHWSSSPSLPMSVWFLVFIPTASLLALCYIALSSHWNIIAMGYSSPLGGTGPSQDPHITTSSWFGNRISFLGLGVGRKQTSQSPGAH